MNDFQRTTFATDRTMEFFTEKELGMQIGHDVDLWPLALVKELIDNSIDACEDAGIAPDVRIELEEDAVSVADNGPGLPQATLERSLDYLVRVSDKSYYVSPTRGQLGNALKCVWAAPFVVSGGLGRVEVTTGGLKHRIEVTMDRIAGRPSLKLTSVPDAVVKNGTLVTMHWDRVASYLEQTEDDESYNGGELTLQDLLLRYFLFNPHLSMGLHTEGETWFDAADDPGWRKWRPNQATSPHWYTPEQFRSLIGAYLIHDMPASRGRTVRELVAEFDGLKGTAKQKAVTDSVGLTGALFSDLISGNDIDIAAVSGLLAAMQREARPVKPEALGVIGKQRVQDNLTQRYNLAPDSIRYAKAVGEAEGLPFIVEVAFGVSQEDGSLRELIAGINWTPALIWPFRSLWDILIEARVDEDDPIVLMVHLACPRVGYHDRGKTSLDLPRALHLEIRKQVTAVTRGWTTAKQHADRSRRVKARDLERLRKATKPEKMTIKEAAYQVMAAAYEKASGALGLANARQIMYAARPFVLALTDGECWKNSAYFTQALLPDFMDDSANAPLTRDWDVVFDARGHFAEPHTDHRTDLGTVGVREYIADWTESVDEDLNIELDHRCPTSGPTNRYRYALFIEKEGFDPHLTRARIAARFDIAIMSTKGMSVTAARSLVESLSNKGVTILVLHDFDKSGLSILDTLRTDTRRYRFRRPPKVIDLGLRLADAQQMGLESEPVTYDSDVDPRVKLRACGATEAECNFLVEGGRSKAWTGRRVELNAMDSVQFIAFLEAKLKEIGAAEKVVPAREILAAAWRRAWRLAAAQEAIDQVAERDGEPIEVPDDVGDQVAAAIAGSDQPWDEVLWNIVRQQRIKHKD